MRLSAKNLKYCAIETLAVILAQGDKQRWPALSISERNQYREMATAFINECAAEGES